MIRLIVLMLALLFILTFVACNGGEKQDSSEQGSISTERIERDEQESASTDKPEKDLSNPQTEMEIDTTAELLRALDGKEWLYYTGEIMLVRSHDITDIVGRGSVSEGRITLDELDERTKTFFEEDKYGIDWNDLSKIRIGITRSSLKQIQPEYDAELSLMIDQFTFVSAAMFTRPLNPDESYEIYGDSTYSHNTAFLHGGELAVLIYAGITAPDTTYDGEEKENWRELLMAPEGVFFSNGSRLTGSVIESSYILNQ
jgi:hypothetical protein